MELEKFEGEIDTDALTAKKLADHINDDFPDILSGPSLLAVLREVAGKATNTELEGCIAFEFEDCSCLVMTIADDCVELHIGMVEPGDSGHA